MKHAGHKITNIHCFKWRNLHIDLTNWFAIRRFGWNLNGHNKHTFGLQAGWLQVTFLRDGRWEDK